MQGGGLTIREMCEAAAVSRASYYRNWRKREPREEDLALRDAIQRQAVKDRHCGYRRITKFLKRDGWMGQVGPATRVEVEVKEPTVTHVLSVQQIQRWLESTLVQQLLPTTTD